MQFDASKKMKVASPVSKPMSSEKGARHSIDGSPSAKGCIGCFMGSWKERVRRCVCKNVEVTKMVIWFCIEVAMERVIWGRKVLWHYNKIGYLIKGT